MKHCDLIVLDLETTSNQEQREEIPDVVEHNSIIEIGAVYVASHGAFFEKKGTFQRLVSPDEPITPFIESITHITNDMVEGKPKWDVVGQEFVDWAKELGGNIKKLRLAAWGNYFDMPILRKLYRRYGVQMPFSGTMFDIKTIAMMWCFLAGKRTDKLSVEKVAQYMGLKTDGQYHRALVDAQMEADIYIKAMESLRDGHYIPNKDGKPFQYLTIDPWGKK